MGCGPIQLHACGAWKESPGAEHTLEKQQGKYTPPPPGKVPWLEITALPSYFLYEYSSVLGSHSEGMTEEPVGAYAKIQALDTKDASLADVKSLQFPSPSTYTGFVGRNTSSSTPFIKDLE